VTKCDEQLTIVYSPIGQILKQRDLTRSDVSQIFDIMEDLYKFGIIHRDLSPNHFMKVYDKVNNKDQIFLIDFGSALILDQEILPELNQSKLDQDTEFHGYQGSVEFASQDILPHISNPKK